MADNTALDISQDDLEGMSLQVAVEYAVNTMGLAVDSLLELKVRGDLVGRDNEEFKKLTTAYLIMLGFSKYLGSNYA